MNEPSPALSENELRARVRELEAALEALTENSSQAVDLRADVARALVDGERRYRQLMDHSSAFICTHDMNGVLLSVNRAAADRLGRTPAEMVGHNIEEFIELNQRERFLAYLREVASEPTVSGVLTIRRRDGERSIWAYLSSRFQEPGQEARVLGHAQDITEMKRLEETLQLTQFSVDKAADAVFWIGCRSGIYNGVNILQTHCRWYVTHWFFLNEIERGRARIPVKCKSLNHAQNRRSYPHDIIS